MGKKSLSDTVVCSMEGGNEEGRNTEKLRSVEGRLREEEDECCELLREDWKEKVKRHK